MAAPIANPLEAARTARHSLGVGIEAPLPDIIATIEDGVGVAVGVLELPASIACATASTNEHSFVFANGNLPADDIRFALAHAYARHVLGHGDTISSRDEVFGDSDDPEVARANTFAREFLAPKAAIDRSLERWALERVDPRQQPEQASRLARYFGISSQVAVERLAETDRLEFDGKRWASDESPPTMTEAAALGSAWAAVDLVSRSRSMEFSRLPRMPARLQRAAIEAYRRGLTSLSKMADALGHTPESATLLLEELGVPLTGI